MKSIYWLTLMIALSSCGSKSGSGGSSGAGPSPRPQGCAVQADSSTPARIARSAFEMRQACSASEDSVVATFAN